MIPIEPDSAVSKRMRGIRRTGTKAELLVGAMLIEMGLAYRKNVKALPGSPDFANQKRRWAVFVNGCFWHHHTGCRRATVPKSNVDFWTDKFRTNRSRDARAIRNLRSRGFTVVVLWECDGEHARRKLQRSLNRVA